MLPYNNTLLIFFNKQVNRNKVYRANQTVCTRTLFEMLAGYLLAIFAIKTNALQHMELNIQSCNIFLT